MLAIKGIYNNGEFKLNEKAPMDNVEVIVIFNTKGQPLLDDSSKQEEKMSDEETMRLFRQFTGSIDRDIDYEKERDEYLNSKGRIVS